MKIIYRAKDKILRTIINLSWLGILIGGSTLTPQNLSAAISFIQVANQDPRSPTSSVPVTYAKAQTAGNLNVVVIGTGDTIASVASVTDTMGNAYQPAIGPTLYTTTLTQWVYYAKSIVAAPAGNVVTVKFTAAARYPDVKILEYSGIDPISPIDGAVALTGATTTSNSGSLTTANANDLLFAANDVNDHTSGAGTGFTLRISSNPDGNIAEDRVVTATGTYNATAP